MLVGYRGGEGMLAWAFHRISGVAIWLFVILHVIDIFLVVQVRVGPFNHDPLPLDARIATAADLA